MEQQFEARKRLAIPGYLLVAVSLLSTVVGLLNLAGNWLRPKTMPEGLDPSYALGYSTGKSISPLWTIGIGIFVGYASIRMINLKSYRTARLAALVSCFPFCSPCCVLGIPFGIWAFILLGKPEIRAAFDD